MKYLNVFILSANHRTLRIVLILFYSFMLYELGARQKLVLRSVSVEGMATSISTSYSHALFEITMILTAVHEHS